MWKRLFGQACLVILRYQMWPLCQNHLTPNYCSWGLDPCNRPCYIMDLFAYRYRNGSSFETFTQTCCCLPDWPLATFISRPLWLIVSCLTVINGRWFQGSLPRRSAGAVWWQSVTDCRVMNCRDREQAISMQRCFPPDHLIQGPDLVTQVIIPSLSELLDTGGTCVDFTIVAFTWPWFNVLLPTLYIYDLFIIWPFHLIYVLPF